MQGNQKIKNVSKVEVTKAEILDMNLFVNQSNYKVIKEPEYALKAKTKTVTKPRSVMGIETPLDTMSIALQDGRESNQKGSSKQMTSATPPLVKPPQSQ